MLELHSGISGSNRRHFTVMSTVSLPVAAVAVTSLLPHVTEIVLKFS